MTRKLRDLPGWAEATRNLFVATNADGKQYDLRMGQWLRTVGAFVAPPSVTHVSRDLVKCLTIGLVRQDRVVQILEVQASERKVRQVVSMVDYRWRRSMRSQNEEWRRRQLSGDWSDTWTAMDERGGDSTL